MKPVELFGRLAIFWMALFILLISNASNVFAASNDIVINELMYNPASGIDDEEYLELYNRSSTDIDISGWCFTTGIAACFPSSTIVPAGGYFLLSRNNTVTTATYGVGADAIYTGKLDNGGEQLILKDAALNTIIDFSYDDASPWPASPDGSGPSLELKDPLLSPIASSFGGSLASGGTPKAVNSSTNSNLPEIINVSKLQTTQSTSSTPLVTTQVSNTASVSLVYKVMFEDDVTVAMFDDGTHGDGTAGDGLYGANIPAQEAGKLVRYKVQATNISGSVYSPSSDDSINYYSYVVDDGKTSTAPIFRWYIDEADFLEMNTNHTSDDMQFPAVIMLGDKIFDNSKVRVKGASSASYPKKKYKFELPAGYSITDPFFSYSVDEFELEMNFLHYFDIFEQVAWKTYDHFGFASPQDFTTEVLLNHDGMNSGFYGMYTISEDFDKSWREVNDFQSGAFYKGAYNKKTRLDEDNSDINNYIANLETLQGEELKNYLLDNLDIANIINYNAVSAVIRQEDWGLTNSNSYNYRDTEGTGRWEYMPYDIDSSYQPMFFSAFTVDPISPMYPIPSEDSPTYEKRLVERAMFSFPEFREMYYRRVATVYDELYGKNLSIEWFEDLYNGQEELIQKDIDKWLAQEQETVNSLTGGAYMAGLDYPEDFPAAATDGYIFNVSNNQEAKDIWFYNENYAKNKMASYRSQGYFPASQPQESQVIINEIMYAPEGGNDYEYLELYNPNDYAVDVSGWYFEGLEMTLPEGSVLQSKGYGLVVGQDTPSFRDKYGAGKYILGQYGGDLSDSGETLSLLRANGSLSSRVAYQASGDWPALGLLSGRSLALINVDADESSYACWAPSSSLGTPGYVNDYDVSWLGADECGKIQSKSDLANTGDDMKIVMLGASLLIALGAHFFISVNSSNAQKKNKEYSHLKSLWFIMTIENRGH